MHEEPASKTRRKAEMHELQSLGVRLLDLPHARVAALGLPETLDRALGEARRITSHEARRRHLQYIGRLMRDIDPEPIRALLAEQEGHSAAARARHKRLEQWRERLLADDEALTEFAQAHGAANLQALRAVIRNARREIAAAQPPRAQRELFRLLREAMVR